MSICLAVAFLCSCGSPKLTWEGINKMVDEGAYRADIDEAVKTIGPETHPASQTVLKFFGAIIKNNLDEAWQYVEKNSPFAQARKGLEGFKKLHDESSKIFDYKSCTIRSIDIGKLAGGVRMVKVYYQFTYHDKAKKREAVSEGAYNMSNLTGEWMIFSEDK